MLLTLVPAFFKVFSRIAPKPAANLGFRLFCTPMKENKKSKNHLKILESAQAVFASAATHHIEYANGTVAAYEFLPKTESGNYKTVFVVHGWRSEALLMYRFVEPLLEKNYRVICVDLPGHGQSSGKVFHVPIGVEALHACCDTLGDYDSMISHSLGGAVVSTTVAGTIPGFDARPASKLVMICPPNSMPKIFDDFIQTVKLSPASAKHFLGKVRQLVNRDITDFVVADQLATTPDEILVIHAPDDKEVNFSAGEAIAQCKESAKLIEAKGLGHRRILFSDTVIDNTVSFLSTTET